MSESILSVSDSMSPMIECDNLVKIYKTKEVEVVALQGLDLTVQRGEFMAIIGKSGSGKSTLLNIIAGLDRPSAGKITVDGKDLLKFNLSQLTKYNRETIGFVWQNNARNLIPYLSAAANVEVPMMIAGKKKRKERARYLLDLVGLSNKYESKLKELSGGEQQRVAIAIALANKPKLLLADEPTGSVDSKTAYSLLETFGRLNSELGVTIVIVTHDNKVSQTVKRVVAISDGMISSEMLRKENYAQRIKELGDDHEHHDKYAVVDRKGRIRIPEEYIEELKLNDNQRVKIRKIDNGIEIYKE